MINTENMIAAIFKNDIQIKRVRKELQLIEQLPKKEFLITYKQLQENFSIMVSMYIIFQVEIPPLPQLNSGRPIVFCIYLDNKFPFVFPKVHLLSHITKPTLADGRDYIDDVLHQQWSPSVLLHQIIEQMKKFFDTIRQQQHKREYLLSLGKFYEKQEFEGNLGLEDVEFYSCKEMINGKQQFRMFQLSSSYILQLEWENKLLILVSATRTGDLLKIDKIENNIILTWKTSEENNFKTQTLISQKPDEFIDSIKSYKAGSSGKRIHEDEVTIQKFENLQIQQLLQQVEDCEKEFQMNLNKVTLNLLMDSYQKVIEYYSAFSDVDYKQYVIHLQTLLGREDVQQILSNGQ